MDQQIWQWTLTKDAIAPCFVRDVLDMRQHNNRAFDFFWLGHIPCRTVLLVGMVVGVQVYDKRSIYTIDDGTAVIDCVLRHPHPPVPRSPRVTSTTSTKANLQPQPPSPKKMRLGNAKFTDAWAEPPPPITQPGYPVRVVGRVLRHYQSKQIHADTIETCPSTLDEIAHLENVIELHKTKYSRAVPFVPPAKSASRVPLNTSTPQVGVDTDASVFSSASRPQLSSSSAYTLPPPPHMPLPLQNRNRPSTMSTNALYADCEYARAPSSPTASSIASSTPSSPCKPSSPVKTQEAPSKPKLRHPSRLHTRDLTANTFRLYIKHYMDNAPPPFLASCPSPSRSTCGGVTTPTKRARDESGSDDLTPRPLPRRNTGGILADCNDADYEDKDGPNLGFTLSHLRRVPELTLLAARVVRAEARKRDRADRDKERGDSRIASSASASLTRSNGCGEKNKTTFRTGTGIIADPPRKKMRRLFSWAVVKLYEEGSIVLWDGDVRPLPVPPPPTLIEEGARDESGLWKRGDDTLSTVSDFSYTAASVLYMSSASAPLYSHYHAPRRPSDSRDSCDHDVVDADVDPAQLSDPPADEEAYIPLTPRFLAGYVREALGVLRGCGNRHDRMGVNGRAGRTGKEATPQDILAYMQRTDARWARLGTWAVEEALAVLRAG